MCQQPRVQYQGDGADTGVLHQCKNAGFVLKLLTVFCNVAVTKCFVEKLCTACVKDELLKLLCTVKVDGKRTCTTHVIGH